jgi:hypothetical protein
MQCAHQARLDIDTNTATKNEACLIVNARKREHTIREPGWLRCGACAQLVTQDSAYLVYCHEAHGAEELLKDSIVC